MKYDIALHELMRLDEYAEEEKKQDAQADLAEQPTGKEGTPAPTESTADNPDPAISVDIPTDTVINYDEPPTEPSDAPVTSTVVRNDLTPSELADLPAAEDIISDDEMPLINAPEDSTLMNNELTHSEVADLSAAEAIIRNDEMPTELSRLTPEIEIDRPLPDPTMPTAENIISDVETATESFAKHLESIPANTAGFFGEVISAITEFYITNRQLLKNLGIIALAFIAAKLAFAGLSAIDDIPLVSPLLKLVGLYYVSRFVWNYLIRERDRQQLVEQFNSLKSQVLGDRT